ncbi:flagellar FliJ family protein [Cellulomonas sp. ATA003]|uniref:flagellar FliJ family protein n=1 Tax=Cellulomonas sp. ATA003 TaxID=3073064 RepID=UPI00287361D0|nr:flagellar FliJ family protein [Cellulomonas sp. ATA003]WNB85241.1 flagellar FliJ family protein [Cellulomonas sp. ATA003]
MERAFRLAGLLRLRTMQEEQAAARLAAANGALRVAEQRRTATLGSLAGHAMPPTGDAGAWSVAVAGRSALRHLLADAAVDVHHAGEEVGAHTAQWSAARSRSVGLEKLQDQHRAAVAADDARAEQIALDEVAARTRRPALGAVPAAVPGAPARPTSTTSTHAARPQRSPLPLLTQEPPHEPADRRADHRPQRPGRGGRPPSHRPRPARPRLRRCPRQPAAAQRPAGTRGRDPARRRPRPRAAGLPRRPRARRAAPHRGP